MCIRDSYQILGVSKTATEDEIRKEYRSLARKHHPDLNPGNHAAEDKFKEINEAYEVLSDSAKRLKYDQVAANPHSEEDFRSQPGRANGRANSRNGGAGFAAEHGGEDFSDLFEGLFGGRRAARGGPTFRMKGEDVNATILLTLEEAHTGRCV